MNHELYAAFAIGQIDMRMRIVGLITSSSAKTTKAALAKQIEGLSLTDDDEALGTLNIKLNDHLERTYNEGRRHGKSEKRPGFFSRLFRYAT